MATYDPRRELIRSGNQRRVQRGSRLLQGKLRQAAPDKTGKMRSVTTVAASGYRAQTRVATDYASYTNVDTPPHEIRARGKALRFNFPAAGPPQPHFYTRVMHPGTSNVTDWYGDTLDDWTDILQRIPVK